MDDAVATALADAFPGREVVEDEDPADTWNPHSVVRRVGFADGSVAYCKLATAEKSERVSREAAALRYVGARDGPAVPAVLAAAPDAARPYLVTGELAGSPVGAGWADAPVEERERRLRDVGRGLATLHALPAPCHGRIRGGDPGGLELSPGPWPEVLATAIRRQAEPFDTSRFPDHVDRLVAAVRTNRDRLTDAPVALLHGDPSRSNAWRTPDGPGFVDWELAYCGDPTLEVVRAEAQGIELPDVDATERLRVALHEGYREVAGSLPAGYEHRRPVYHAVVFRIQSTTFECWAPDAPESTEDLAAWVERELTERLDRIT